MRAYQIYLVRSGCINVGYAKSEDEAKQVIDDLRDDRPDETFTYKPVSRILSLPVSVVLDQRDAKRREGAQ